MAADLTFSANNSPPRDSSRADSSLWNSVPTFARLSGRSPDSMRGRVANCIDRASAVTALEGVAAILGALAVMAMAGWV